ncbi:ABC transporter ATP-binding protein [Catellatospora sp. KI3]|uniref:ABC transporter ATP-binding protein n=1 Tax=Catellatospora sp. KI3 TaxID=3041620 RepID=UPI002482D334|nr:ABC transporter ATP-binding protein [Catellatospora sp. KI3]MDI1461426.1 ABC transporter ATP-binding protein [Catellatospora sp. KI3]
MPPAPLPPVPTRRALALSAGLIRRAAPGLAASYLLVTAVVALLPVAAASLTRAVFDEVAAAAPVAVIVRYAGLLALTGFLLVVGQQVLRYQGAELGRRVARTGVADLYTALDRFVGLAPFESPRTADRIMQARQASYAAGQTVSDVSTLVASGLTLLGFVAALWAVSPVATAVVVAAAAPTVLAEARLARRRADLIGRMTPHDRRELFYQALLGDPDAAKEIRMFGLGGFLRGRMLAERAAADDGRRRLDLRDASVQGALGLAGAVTSGAGLVWAVLAAGRGELSLGDVAMFVAAVAGAQAATAGLAQGAAALQLRLAGLAHLAAVLDAGPELPVGERPAPPLRHGIELRDVWFRYGEDHPWVLRGVDLAIPAGTALALVGRNGSGKSTLVKLLCRLYDPTRGAILWDGVDLRELDPASLRARLSGVFQDHVHYELSAADNIGLGDLAVFADRAALRDAAGRAGIAPVLAALPDGYDTMLTRTFTSNADRDDPSTGVNLSGGQWQRLALARAFLRTVPDLMVLDEPSSGLDPEAEHDVHTRVLAYRQGQTSLLISHRLNAVRDADVIAVLDGGRVAERGGHDELLAAGGVYARLFRLQASGYQQPVEVP